MDFFHITATDRNLDTFHMLLNIFHLRMKNIPRNLPLELLAQVGVLVDYYDCQEAVSFFSFIWTENIKTNIKVPDTYCRDLILLMWVSWAFDLSDQFRKTTAIAIQACTEPIHTLDLPLPLRFASMFQSGNRAGKLLTLARANRDQKARSYQFRHHQAPRPF